MKSGHSVAKFHTMVDWWCMLKAQGFNSLNGALPFVIDQNRTWFDACFDGVANLVEVKPGPKCKTIECVETEGAFIVFDIVGDPRSENEEENSARTGRGRR